MFRKIVGCAAVAMAAAQYTAEQQRQQAEIARQQSLLLVTPPSAHADVVVTSLLPTQSADEIPTGEIITMACTVINNGEAPLNISGVLGSLNDHENFQAAFLENFTGMPVGEVVEPGGELTLEYRVLPRVPGPMVAQLSSRVIYEDSENYYSSTCYNATVTFVKGKTNPSVAVQQYLPYALALALAAAVVYMLLWDVLFPKRAGRGAAAGGSDDEEPTLRSSKKGGKKRD